jgi:hypothetical protein
MEVGCVCFAEGLIGYTVGSSVHFRSLPAAETPVSIDFFGNEHKARFLGYCGESVWVVGNANKQLIYLRVAADAGTAETAFTRSHYKRI